MRTTVDIPEHVLRRAKATAALEGDTLKTFFVKALEHEITRHRPAGPSGHRVRLPLVHSKHPDALSITNADVADALAEEEVSALAD